MAIVLDKYLHWKVKIESTGQILAVFGEKEDAYDFVNLYNASNGLNVFRIK